MVLPKKNVKEKSFKILDYNLSKQYILLILNECDKKAVKHKINFIAMLFFISQNLNFSDCEYFFEASDTGISSEVVERNLESLIQEKFIKKDENGYHITYLGVGYLSSRDFAEDVLNLTESMKDLFDDLSACEVLTLIHFTFPDFLLQSIIDRIIKNRKKTAFKLYDKGKISASKACEIADIHFIDFISKAEFELLL